MSASDCELVSPFYQEVMTCLAQGRQGKIFVIVTKVISDAAFAKMVQGAIWRGRKERGGVKGKEGQNQLKVLCSQEAEAPPRSGFKSFSCMVTGFPVHELAEHFHGIKSLLKWSNFKWPKLTCAVAHFKWIQCIYFANLVNSQSWILYISLPVWIWFLNQDQCRKQPKASIVSMLCFTSPHSGRYNSQLCLDCTQNTEERTPMQVLEKVCKKVLKKTQDCF